MTTLVVPEPPRLKGVPETIANGPGLTVTVPLVSAAWPKLVSVKLACGEAPTATVPKSRLAGTTDNCPGVIAEPVTGLVLLPPLLIKTAVLLKLPPLAGLNV